MSTYRSSTNVHPQFWDAQNLSDNQALFFAAFTFAHRARCAAAIFLRAAAESVRLPRIGTTFAFSRTFAQRALWAAAILARADADNFLAPVPSR